MKLRIGTRGSALALAQTNLVAAALRRARPDLEIEVREVQTLGDKRQNTPQAAVSDKKEWVLELELALLAGEIDCAVHSGKDVPLEIELGTELLPLLERESPFDVFIGKDGLRFADLPAAAAVGTASLRRKAELRRARPDLHMTDHRGNVPTRIKKLTESAELSGIVLAEAGLNRLGIDVPRERFLPGVLMPAVNQGIIAAQFLAAREDVRALLQQVVHGPTAAAFFTERACVAVLGADCHSAVCIFAETAGDTLTLSARVLSPDGRECLDETRSGAATDAAALGREVGAALLARGAARLL